ncbi:vacuolar import and degradation protein-domain-containing protein [Flammula alnicola]|nr:vacuolar import and degradation protein-domain-containing protein [Flammula alnicola]
MPSEQFSSIQYTDIQDVILPVQVKVCSSCHSTLSDPNVAFFLATAEPIVCTICRERPAQLTSPSDHRQLRIDQDAPYSVRPPASHELPVLPNTRRSQPDPITQPVFDDALSSSPSSSSSSPSSDPAHTYHSSHITSSGYARKPVLLSVQCNITSVPVSHRHPGHFSSATPYEATPTRQQQQQSTADPLVDVTRLRVRSRAHHCLYPGAIFQGTQKSGRNSYDVNVTIVDVNFASSNLCGYLRIRGLTDDWPELTTYFDAEIIGNRYGFLTQNWGASQHEDLVHWSRFSAFKHIRHEAKRPHMTLDDRDRGVVFMRWKERFLVPDHRVQDISGASFAGFYYVCVDFNPPSTSSAPTEDSAMHESALEIPLTPESEDSHPFFQHRTRTKSRSRTRRDSSVRRKGPSPAPINPPVATMSGFYYHQNSEPYQQLSLTHVPEQTSSSFEFR